MGLRRGPITGAVVGLAFVVVVAAVRAGWWLLWHNPFTEKMGWQGYGALWSAAATLVTGLAAVGGAVFVGARQSEIQARQVALQEQALRLELLERRADAIKKLTDFYRTHVPPQNQLSPELRFEIYDSLARACIIFPEKIGELFQKCLNHVNIYHAGREAAEASRENYDFTMAHKQGVLVIELWTTMQSDFDALLKAMIEHARVEV